MSTHDTKAGRARDRRLAESAAPRVLARLVEFVRELDRGIAVMHGHRPPVQPRPAELDTLARTGALQLPDVNLDTPSVPETREPEGKGGFAHIR